MASFFPEPPKKSWLPLWAWRKQSKSFMEALIDCKATDDALVAEEVQRVLLSERWKRAIAPYAYVFKLAWEVLRGRYRKSAKEVHGSADQAPGFSNAGTGYASPIAYISGGSGSIIPGPIAPAIEDAGIRAGEVVAYRCWRLHDDGFLHSVYQEDFVWKPGETVEGDAAGGDGVHGFKDRLAMGSYGYGYAGRSSIVVTGTVDLWGEVYEHERGYRASKAAIASIDDSPHYDAKALRKLYGLTRKRAAKKKPSRSQKRT
jgi:hypothetical protein